MLRLMGMVLVFLVLPGAAACSLRVPFFERREIASGIREVPSAKIQAVAVEPVRGQVEVTVQVPKVSPEWEMRCFLYLFEGELRLLPELSVWKRAILEGLDLKAPITPIAKFRFDDVTKPGRYCLLTVFQSKKSGAYRSPGVIFWYPKK